LLIVYLLVLRIKSFVDPTSYQILETDTFLTQKVFGFIESPLAHSIFSFLLLYLQAVYINRLVIKNKLALNITLIPGMIYCFLVSFLPEYHVLSPLMIANTFFLLAIGQIFKIYKKPRVADTLFNVGFLIGIATLFVPKYSLLMISGFISIIILRSVKFREIIQILSGFLVVLILNHGFLYLFDSPFRFYLSEVSLWPKIDFKDLNALSLYFIIGMILTAVFGVFNYNKYTIKKSIQVQKKIDILYWVLVSSLFLTLICKDTSHGLALLSFIPLSIFLAMSLLKIKNPITQEIVHLAALIALFYYHFGPAFL